MKLIFNPKDGTATHIYNEGIEPNLGNAEIKRASHVEPTKDGQWTADMSPSNGPVLGPFPKRSAAIAAEINWLEENL